MKLTLTGLYASLLGMWMIWLGYRVVRLRVKYRVGLLDGDQVELKRNIRIHGNAAEWIPISLILFACAESQELGWLWLHIAGVVLVISRLLHMHGLQHSTGRSFGRAWGMVGTWSVIIALGLFNIISFFYYLYSLDL